MKNMMRELRATSLVGLALIPLTASLMATPAAFAGPIASILTVGDFNQDGISDILAEKVSAPNAGLLWIVLIDGATGERLTSEFPFQFQEGYEFLAVGNFDGNLSGQSQIAARKTSGTPAEELGMVRLWDLTDDASAPSGPAEGVLTIAPDPVYSLIGVGDLDGNGVEDFVFIQDNSGPNPGLIRAYLMNTSMQLKQIVHPLAVMAPTVPSAPPGLEVFGVADANGDGYADIFLADRTNRYMRIFLLEENATKGIDVLGQRFVFNLPQNDFDFLGFALIDPGSQADLIFVSNGGPDEGLLEVGLITAGVQGIASSFYPANLGVDFDFVGSGLFDSDTETDLVVKRNSGSSDGLLEFLLLEIDQVNKVKGTTFPTQLDPGEWEERTTRAVVSP